MKRTVRFVEDDEGYVAGDFGDDGEQTMRRIEAGEVIILGLVAFDADALSDDESVPIESRVAEVMLDSLWCIDEHSGAINDTGKDFDASNVDRIESAYLKDLAHQYLHCALCASGEPMVHAFEPEVVPA